MSGRYSEGNSAHQTDELQKQQGPELVFGPLLCISLTMSYFHTGTRTIIGAEAFHCPVRDGKEWDHLAMVIRLNGLPLMTSRANSQSLLSGLRDLVRLNALTLPKL